MFRLGFCRTNELKAWLTTQETNLFRFQLRQLTQKARNEVYQGLLLELFFLQKFMVRRFFIAEGSILEIIFFQRKD